MPPPTDEKNVAQQLAEATRIVTWAFGPFMLGNQIGSSAYFSTCQGVPFYASVSVPSLTSLIVVAFAGYFAWLISDVLIRSGLVALLASQLLRWGWTLAGVSPAQPTIWVAQLLSASLLTVAAVRSSRLRGFLLAMILFVVAFALTWLGIRTGMSAFGRHSVLHHGPGC